MVTPLRVAFFGTPAFAIPTLEALAASRHTVDVVVTQPDRPRGRGQKASPSPVKAFALGRDIPVLQPDRLKDEAFVSAFAHSHVDIAVVAAYGKILPRDLIDRPRLGTINVHASLLPRWRGAAPVHRAILAGDQRSGVTIMRIVPALDAGPMLARESVTIGEDETSAELEPRLALAGGRLLVATMDRLAEGPVAEEPQPDAGVTYAARLDRRESRIDWSQPARNVHNQIRGLQPWPTATVLFHGRRLRLLGSHVENESTAAPPSTVTTVRPDAIVVAAGAGALRLTRVQLEGRPPVAVRDFLAGHRVQPGDRLDPIDVES